MRNGDKLYKILAYLLAFGAGGVIIFDSRWGLPGGAWWAIGLSGAGLIMMACAWFRRSRSGGDALSRKVHLLINDGELEELRRVIGENRRVLDATDESGGKPLHRAAIQGQVSIVRLLLDEGGDVDTREKQFGFTPLHMVACRTYRPVVTAMYPELDRCEFAGDAATSEEDVAGILLERGAEVNARAGFNRTPLHMASVACRAGLVEMLLDGGADIEAEDELGFTPLHYAAFGGDGSVAELIVQAGGPLAATAELDYTPLHTAAEKGAQEVVEVLLRAGADPDEYTRHGRTAVALANQHGHDEIVAMMGEENSNGG